LSLRHDYFSAFRPIDCSPFAGQPAEEPTRALRLYLSNFMIRDNVFSFAELAFDVNGLLPRDRLPSMG
jgi:predicted DNA-binding helix-hairpin-helix protein